MSAERGRPSLGTALVRSLTGSNSNPEREHGMPHAATFRNAGDVTHGDVQKNLENLRMKEIAAANYVSPRSRLKQRLAACGAFAQSRPAFTAMLAENAIEERLASEQVLFYIGQPCTFGATPFYVVMSGQVTVENALEVTMGFIYEGQIFGEGGAIGLTEERTVTIRCTKGKPTTVLRIEGVALEAALIACPEERDKLEENFYNHARCNQEFEKRRDVWLRQTVIPALAGTALLAGCPDEFLYDVAAPLLEQTHRDGKNIVVCGQPADSMLLLLEGTAEIQAKSGAKISYLREGACFGEVAVLDLFPYRTATLKAIGRCRVLQVTSKALRTAIDNSSEELVKVAFARLAESRREQVQKGLPMCALPINARSDDVAVRAVGLMAERIDLAPGQIWVPLPDNDACGPHFGVIVKGRLLLETKEERRLVTALGSGSIFPEGMAAEYHAHARAVTHCECYRIRQSDFLVTVYSMPSAQEWFYRYRLIDKQTRAYLLKRLSGVRGVTAGVMHKPHDDDIHEWKTRRQNAIERARVIKVDQNDAVAKIPSMAKLPCYFTEPPAGRGGGGGGYKRGGPASANTSVQSAPARVTMNRVQSAPGDLQQGNLSGLRLPRLQTAG